MGLPLSSPCEWQITEVPTYWEARRFVPSAFPSFHPVVPLGRGSSCAGSSLGRAEGCDCARTFSCLAKASPRAGLFSKVSGDSRLRLLLPSTPTPTRSTARFWGGFLAFCLASAKGRNPAKNTLFSHRLRMGGQWECPLASLQLVYQIHVPLLSRHQPTPSSDPAALLGAPGRRRSRVSFF